MDSSASAKIAFLRALDALYDYHFTTKARIEVLMREKINMNPNWMALVVRIMASIPMIVTGIEQIHGDTLAGAQKKQLAMEALGLASTVAPVLDQNPQHQAMMGAAADLASNTIDGVVNLMNASQAAPKTPIAAVSSPNPGQKAPQPVSVLAPVITAEPAGESPKAPSSLDPNPPADPVSTWP